MNRAEFSKEIRERKYKTYLQFKRIIEFERRDSEDHMIIWI